MSVTLLIHQPRASDEESKCLYIKTDFCQLSSELFVSQKSIKSRAGCSSFVSLVSSSLLLSALRYFLKLWKSIKILTHFRVFLTLSALNLFFMEYFPPFQDLFLFCFLQTFWPQYFSPPSSLNIRSHQPPALHQLNLQPLSFQDIFFNAWNCFT